MTDPNVQRLRRLDACAVSDALDKLGVMGVQSMLLEGGPRLAGSFLDAGEVDELRIFIAPISAVKAELVRPASRMPAVLTARWTTVGSPPMTVEIA